LQTFQTLDHLGFPTSISMSLMKAALSLLPPNLCASVALTSPRRTSSALVPKRRVAYHQLQCDLIAIMYKCDHWIARFHGM
jgi:hypothetical protein